MNSTFPHFSRHAATVAATASCIAAGFFPARYSICTALTGAATCSLGHFASFSAAHTVSTPSVLSATGTDTALCVTADATDLISRLSIFTCSTGGSSITDTPARASSFASSIFSRKLSVYPAALPACRMVTSVMDICLIKVLLTCKKSLKPLGFRDETSFAVPPCLSPVSRRKIALELQ